MELERDPIFWKDMLEAAETTALMLEDGPAKAVPLDLKAESEIHVELLNEVLPNL
jgi:hypothetical protein